jgi:hypothetical protein
MPWKCKLAAVVPLLGLILTCSPSTASADTFSCDASALRGTVLGAPPLEPVTANRGSAVCRDASASLNQVPAGLPTGLVASAASAQTAEFGGASAGAIGGVSGIALGTAGLPLTIPIPAVVSGLAPITVPLTLAQQLLTGLGASISVDIRPAVEALLNLSPVAAHLLDVGGAQSTAVAQCSGTRAQLSGVSQITGLTVLGQSLPTNQIVNQALALVAAQAISPATLDVTKVVLPAGLSFSTLVIGPALQTAVSSALAVLPAIQVPATLAQVSVTPAQQVQQNGQLTQQALHVAITALGQTLADLVFGEARISNSAVHCSPGPNPYTSPVATTPGTTTTPQAPSVTTALACTKRALTLIDVLERSNHVTLYGAADQRLVGHVVSIYFAATGRRVARAVVRPDGSFRTTAPLPPAAIRGTNSARYEAIAGGEHSLDLKLQRRLIVDSMRWSHGKVIIRGRVTLPLASPPAPIYIQRRASCSREVTAQRVYPRADGSWQAVLQAPPHQQVAVYRAATEVRNNVASRKLFATFTLPREVSLG